MEATFMERKIWGTCPRPAATFIPPLVFHFVSHCFYFLSSEGQQFTKRCHAAGNRNVQHSWLNVYGNVQKYFLILSELLLRFLALSKTKIILGPSKLSQTQSQRSDDDMFLWRLTIKNSIKKINGSHVKRLLF